MKEANIVKRLVQVVIVFLVISKVASAGATITVTPTPPPGVSDALTKIAGWFLWAFMLLGGLSVVYGVVKLYSGDKRSGALYIVGGLVLVAVVVNLSRIVSSI
jgi:hypothetical protein